MHQANEDFWQYCSEKYEKYFNKPSTVLECGSYNINGTVRDFFDVDFYIGIDWRPGSCVDVVALLQLHATSRRQW